MTAELTAVTANPKKKPMAIWKMRLNHMKIIPLQVCRREDGEKGHHLETSPTCIFDGVFMS